jgi:hypothetical protein
VIAVTRSSRLGKVGGFAVRTFVRLLSWLLVAVIITLATQWEQSRQQRLHAGTELTGAEHTAKLSRLNDSAPDSGDPGEQSNRQNFAMAYGIQEAKVDYEIFLNPDCSPKTNFYLYVREKPLHGTVRIDLDKNYTGYDSDTQRYKCNLAPVDSPSIFYRRNAGFTGRDRFSVEVFEPGGFVRLTRYIIDAR